MLIFQIITHTFYDNIIYEGQQLLNHNTRWHAFTNAQTDKYTDSLELCGRLLKKLLRRVASHSMLSCRLARAFRSLTSLRISFWGINLSPRFPVKTSDSLANAALRETKWKVMNISIISKNLEYMYVHAFVFVYLFIFLLKHILFKLIERKYVSFSFIVSITINKKYNK